MHILFQYGRFGSNSSQPTPLMVWYMLAISEMLENGHFGEIGHFGNDQNLTLELISVHQTTKRDPNNGLDELEPIWSYLNHIPTLFAKNTIFYLLFVVVFHL